MPGNNIKKYKQYKISYCRWYSAEPWCVFNSFLSYLARIFFCLIDHILTQTPLDYNISWRVRGNVAAHVLFSGGMMAFCAKTKSKGADVEEWRSEAKPERSGSTVPGAQEHSLSDGMTMRWYQNQPAHVNDIMPPKRRSAWLSEVCVSSNLDLTVLDWMTYFEVRATQYPNGSGRLYDNISLHGHRCLLSCEDCYFSLIYLLCSLITVCFVLGGFPRCQTKLLNLFIPSWAFVTVSLSSSGR